VRVYRGGRKVEDWTVEKYQFPKEIDAKVFLRP